LPAMRHAIPFKSAVLLLYGAHGVLAIEQYGVAPNSISTKYAPIQQGQYARNLRRNCA
jgi:hypothetical protein